MGKKKRYRGLKEKASQLPPFMINTTERHFVDGSEMLDLNRVKDDGGTYIPGKVYVDVMPVMMEANHKRRMKKLVNKYGPDIADQYVEANKNSKN